MLQKHPHKRQHICQPSKPSARSFQCSCRRLTPQDWIRKVKLCLRALYLIFAELLTVSKASSRGASCAKLWGLSACCPCKFLYWYKFEGLLDPQSPCVWVQGIVQVALDDIWEWGFSFYAGAELPLFLFLPRAAFIMSLATQALLQGQPFYPGTNPFLQGPHNKASHKSEPKDWDSGRQVWIPLAFSCDNWQAHKASFAFSSAATWHSPFLLAALLHVYVCNASPLARLCKPFGRAYVQALLQGLALLQGTMPLHCT